MSAGILPLGKSLRIAYITKAPEGKNYVECEFYDKFGEKSFTCPKPHPYAGRGGGIFVGPECNTLVLVSNGPQEQWFIVGVLPDPNFYQDIEGAKDVRVGETPYPMLYKGEISVKGNTGQRIDWLRNGNLAMDAGIGTKSYDLELSKAAQGMFVRVNNLYSFTEAGRTIEGLIKRDLNETEDPNETHSTDFLTGESYEQMLTAIGRSPKNEVQNRTTTITKPVTRNPGLVERRSIVYEFGDSFGVQGFDHELDAVKTIQQQKTAEEQAKEVELSIERLRADPSTRENRRSDVLDLNLRNYNHLIEKVEGTLVDIYGNVLDLNRSKINIPEVDTLTSNQTDPDSKLSLKRIYDFLRRSVKYHFEINSRKSGEAATTPDPTVPASGLGSSIKDHSRFSVDIDAEGLTKINIPASSETGNIPILSRHIITRDIQGEDPNGVPKNQDKNGFVDVKSIQFGAKDVNGDVFAGALITDSTYSPETTNNLTITVGSAFHDLLNIANSIFTQGKLKSPDLSGSTILPLNQEINNTIEEIDGIPEANAGGRSLHMNLDGSIEASIGADTIDRKSIVIDTAGGMITHLGRDVNGRSVIAQTDGDVIIQVGGTSIKDPRFIEDWGQNRSGRVEIHFNRTSGDPSKIVIDEDGITIRSEGKLVLSSKGDMALSSDSNLLLNGENIKAYGAVDLETRAIAGAERFISRKGRVI